MSKKNIAETDLFTQNGCVSEVVKPYDKHSPLLPERHPQGDLFICDLIDVVLKGDMQSLEYPFYSLTKKPDRTPRRFEAGDKWIEFRPSTKGLPTIYDKDIMIFCISHVMREKNRTGHAPRRVLIYPHHFLQYTNRQTGGRDYDALCDSIERLDGTRYRTNVVSGGIRTDSWFGMIERVDLKTDERTGKLQSMEITLSEWTMDAINANDVLTLHRDYWRLRRPIERRLYEIVRKHCGGKAEWRISVANLHIKSGSKATRREFRRKLNEVIEDNHLPDFTVELENDVLIARPRDGLKERLAAPQKSNIGQTKLDAKAKNKAKKYAGGWALDFLETQWRAFCESQNVTVRSAEAHFIDFCKRYVEKNGRV